MRAASHYCEDGWEEGAFADCPKHKKAPPQRRIVLGANTLSGYEPPKKARKNE